MADVCGFGSFGAVRILPFSSCMQCGGRIEAALCGQAKAVQNYGAGPVPPCPPSFRTGRASQTQLTIQEKEELLQYIRFFAAHAMPLTITDIEKLG